MFVGHYSVAFAAKSERNKIPLWVLFIAVQFLDYVWATLVLLGIEKLRVIKGFTAGSMLDSYFHPYSHSLNRGDYLEWRCRSSLQATLQLAWLCLRQISGVDRRASLFSRIGFWISLRIPATSRSTTINGKLVLVCGIIGTRSLHWRSRCLALGSCFISREM